MAEKISAQLNEPVAATIAPVMIGPTAPPIFETVFCSPATIETLFLGATSPGKAQTCDAATVVPDFATHKRKTVINTESVNGAKPIQSAISKPIKTVYGSLLETVLSYVPDDPRPSQQKLQSPSRIIKAERLPFPF